MCSLSLWLMALAANPGATGKDLETVTKKRDTSGLAWQVVINLPPAPPVGSIIRVATVGAGGWRISQNPGQTIRFAANPVQWTPVPVAPQLWSVACSSSGLWAAATWPGWIHLSDPSLSGSSPSGSFGAWSGQNLVAAAQADQIYTSTDSGETWVPRATANSWSAVASSAVELLHAGGNHFVVLSQQGPFLVR